MFFAVSLINSFFKSRNTKKNNEGNRVPEESKKKVTKFKTDSTVRFSGSLDPQHDIVIFDEYDDVEIVSLEYVVHSQLVFPVLHLPGWDISESSSSQLFNIVTTSGTMCRTTPSRLAEEGSDLFKFGAYDSTKNIYKIILRSPITFHGGARFAFRTSASEEELNNETVIISYRVIYKVNE
ncbi:hypothetical protein [Alkalihalobacillus sp. LMS39]|uniref:hypothetical protein n=1 Tax=Alkalihalobacillus sp. LMS39 TaxID=2924032 RepID=UPI001FB1C5E1|nr:hypothetical protein [Alkalihalobacillus sp. LMS39]UOE93520.1 hypothetical protein MM271_20395 [Alkalihalobacillus sp. LMS39]